MKITYLKLGRQQAYGQAHLGENAIEIDSRLKGKLHLEILIHEILHIQNPSWEEEEVVKKSKQLCNLLWKEKYRRVEQ